MIKEGKHYQFNGQEIFIKNISIESTRKSVYVRVKFKDGEVVYVGITDLQKFSNGFKAI